MNDGTPCAMKVACTVWSRGKSGDDVKALPIAIIWCDDTERGGYRCDESASRGGLNYGHRACRPFNYWWAYVFEHERKRLFLIDERGIS